MSNKKQKEELFITIDTDGSVEMEYKGKKGKSCTDATQEIELALGKVQDRQKTSDYYKKDPGSVHEIR